MNETTGERSKARSPCARLLRNEQHGEGIEGAANQETLNNNYMTIPEIKKLLDEKKFGEAEVALYELQREDRLNTAVACLFGIFYDDYSNPERSREKAIKSFSVAATGNPPVEEAFIALARLENHSNHVIRIG